MTASVSNIGYGSILKVGDSGVGAGVKAFVEWGTTTAKIRIKWKTAGTAGNGKNITVVVSGASFVITTLDNTAISITVPTTATVAMVIAWLYQQTNFPLYWEADYGATPGDGTGTITARTVTPTASGAEGTEIFTAIAEVKNISISSTTGDIEVTHLGSDDATKEFIPGLTDAGELSFSVNYLAANAGHLGLWNDQFSRTTRNWKLVASNAAATTLSLRGYLKGLNLSVENEQAIQNQISVKLTSKPTWA